MGFPDGSMVKKSPVIAGDRGSIPWSGRSPGEGNGNPLQHSCLENPMDGGAWQATVHGVTKSQTRLSDSHTHTHTHDCLIMVNFELIVFEIYSAFFNYKLKPYGKFGNFSVVYFSSVFQH